MGSGLCREVDEAAPPMVHTMLYPMYVLKVSDFLQMAPGSPPAHGALKEKGLLKIWEPGLFVIFVSHQWLGISHPDPAGQHTSMLRQILLRLIAGSTKVEADVVSQSYGRPVEFTEKTRQQIQEGYLFLDWFAIPQITARQHGVNEELTKSEAALAVQSIPAYVEVANLFVALVAECRHEDRGCYCNYTSWLTRGWCRAELWCHLLSNKSDTSVVLAHSTREVRFMFPLDWQQSTVADGEFTVESDRFIVVKLAEAAVEDKIRQLGQTGPLHLYRFYRAMRQKMLGRTGVSWLPNGFLKDFAFPDVQGAVQSSSQMNGLMCAVLAGDVFMIRWLAERRADVNLRCEGLNDLGFFTSQPLLFAAAKSVQAPRVLETLIDLRADVSQTSDSGGSVMLYARCPGQVQVLLRARADPHSPAGSLGMTPLSGCSSNCDAKTLCAMLDARCDPNPPLSGLGISPLHSCILYGRGNRHAQDNLLLLLERRADASARCTPTGRYDWIGQPARMYARLAGLATLPLVLRHYAVLPGLTPLGSAAFAGDEASACVLWRHGAETAGNDDGHTLQDIAESNGYFHLLPLLQSFNTFYV
ncbi:unnamed protein product [Effrenium voratum]|nr:unnamed protein product [Effrenium voratum]